MLRKYQWNSLTKLQLGKYAEYFTKMEFTLYGFDVYDSEVDDKGIDFVIRRKQDAYYDVQVKGIRGFNYVYFSKDKFILRKNLYAVIAIFFDNNPPQLYLIPSEAWKKSNPLLVSRDYKGKESDPEWVLNLSKKNLTLLQKFSFDNIVETL